ncbi:MAG: asparagine synthetase A [Candidatus Thermoplasmatota archaeon]|jgi:asparaginyl-tRNA synthetase|nr:asparagine synthetase A [Candidatus Thermoplasmatota archaeon]
MNYTKSKKTKTILKIQSEIRQILGNELRKKKFIEIAPVIISPITDPLNHPTSPAKINCYGKSYSLTQSMIFHKQLALRTLDKIFVFSPNIRIEPLDRKNTGRHLFEFTQLDLEVKGAKREEIMHLCEELLVKTIKTLKKTCKKELNFLGRKLTVPKTPFKQIRYKDAYKRYGADFETAISKTHKEPIWIIDMPISRREFYDKEDPEKPGYLRDMDLIYPEGYGEALSGGEREYKYERIKKRIKKKGQKLSQFKEYLEHAKNDLPPSAGFGIGIERLTRFICGLKKIEETSLFPKTPGKKCI